MLDFLVDDDGNLLVDSLSDDIKNIINNITEYLNVSNLDDAFIIKVLKRLETFGYDVQLTNSNDEWLIAFAVNKVISHILTVTNRNDIDNNLIAIAVDRVCGEFLFAKAKTGQLTELPFDFDAVIKAIQIGDTNITYAVGEGSSTDEEKFNALVSYLTSKGENDILCYRKIKW